VLGLHFFRSSVFPSAVPSSLSLESFIENAFTVKFMVSNTEAFLFECQPQGCLRSAEIGRLHRQVARSHPPPGRLRRLQQSAVDTIYLQQHSYLAARANLWSKNIDHRNHMKSSAEGGEATKACSLLWCVVRMVQKIY